MLGRSLSVVSLVFAGLMLGMPVSHASYGAQICKDSGYKCVKVKKGQSWAKLFPNASERDLVMRLNRVNTKLRPGTVIAVPEGLANLTLMDISPFPLKISSPNRTTVVVDQGKLAWGAYDSSGSLVKWGPMSGGQKFCSDIKEECHTPAGQFIAFRKEGEDCKSTQFPVEKDGGGAPMPFCVFFNGGIAFHGSDTVPGYNASHGCVRMYTEDAQWLNNEFVELGKTRVLIDTDLPQAKPKPSLYASSSTGGGGGTSSSWKLSWH